MTQLTDEQAERLKQIRERQIVRLERPMSAFEKALRDDIYLLLSLLDGDSEAAPPPGEWCRCLRRKGHEDRTIECLDSQDVSRIAATAMRDKCVEKVEELQRDWDKHGSYDFRDATFYIVAALESLTLDQMEQNK